MSTEEKLRASNIELFKQNTELKEELRGLRERFDEATKKLVNYELDESLSIPLEYFNESSEESSYVPEEKCFLKQAYDLTHGDRHKTYGSARENMENTAILLNGYLRARGIMTTVELLATDVPILIMLVKIARQGFKSKYDNLIDIAGYVDVWERTAKGLD